MKKNKITVCMIGNAHIDPVWLWTWREGMAEVMASCRSALDRMKEFDAFIFTRAEAATYQWIEDSCPEMFEEIKQRIKEGKWNVVGGWWEQPDCNVPCGESFVRHALYGKKYFKEKFGIDVKVGYNVDSFGHNIGLPQILKKSGIDYYTFMRPEPHEKELPSSMFWWEGLDGSKVLVYRLHGPYCTNHQVLPEHLEKSVEKRHKESLVAACFYGVGNHGGGPTIENIKCIIEMQKEENDSEIVFGTLEQVFQTAEKNCNNFPIVKDDLQHHAVGCYSLHSEVKRLNRKSENALIRAEKFASLASLLINRKYPLEQLSSAWKHILFNQFHDILAGTSLPSAYDDARNTYGVAIHSADYITEASLTNIACHINAENGTDPFIVFNPHSQAVKAPIYYEEKLTSLRDYKGNIIPTQKVSEQFERTATDHEADRDRFVFVDTIPAFGYKLYYAENGVNEINYNLSITDTTIENEYLRISISKETGAITELYDKKQNHHFLS
ncbi:MAG: alpha-mannosidase, partial [Armatimonadota bacterium]